MPLGTAAPLKKLVQTLVIVGALIISAVYVGSAKAASFDCSRAKSPPEVLVCNNQEISKIDDALDKVYRDDLSKADERQKNDLISEQKHWLKHTRNTCKVETCFKHAYWSRLAELKNYFESRSSLYSHESDKAEAIKRVIETVPLYESSLSSPLFCRQLLSDLKKMKDIRFVDPVVQTQSYEDPALDAWREKCHGTAPLNFGYWCESNLGTAVVEDAMDGQCSVGYGMPPFKIFEIPSLSPTSKRHFFFYSDDSYGPMNQDWKKPELNGGLSGFREFSLPECRPDATYTRASSGVRYGNNYNSIIEYQRQYYFLMLNHQGTPAYWLTVTPVGHKDSCDWGPVKS